MSRLKFSTASGRTGLAFWLDDEEGISVVNARDERFDFDQQVGLFLITSRTMGLATSGLDHRPHAANVQYAQVAEAQQLASDGWRLYFVSSSASLHARQIAENPAVAATIYGHDDQVEHIHGLQLEGVASVVPSGSEDWHRVWELYLQKFSFIAAMSELECRVRNQCFYSLTPHWLRWIDNRRGFGWKTEKILRSSV